MFIWQFLRSVSQKVPLAVKYIVFSINVFIDVIRFENIIQRQIARKDK